MMSKSAACFFLLLGFVVVSAVDKCHYEVATQCGQPLDTFRKSQGQRFPTTEAQVEEFCNELKKASDCYEDFSNKCMTPMQLEMIGFLTEGSIKVYDEFCKSKSDLQQQYVKHAPCLNEALQTDEFKEFASYVEAGLENLQEKKPNERLPILCCGYQYITDRSTKLGEERCGREAVDTFLSVVEMATSSLPNVMCQGFEPDGAKCTSVLPPPGTKPTGNLKNSRLAEMFTDLYLKD